MKLLSCALLLIASLAFVLLGCSDNSAPVVAPTDQGAQGLPSPEKGCSITGLTISDFPIWVTPTPDVKLVRGKWHMEKVEVQEVITATMIPSGKPYPLGSGIMVHYLSATFDAITGEGPCYGSWTTTPADNAANGGKWEGTYVGYRFRTSTKDVYTLPLTLKGHGTGGTIDGMQMSVISTLTVNADPVTHLPLGWTGIGTGIIKSR